MLFHRQNSNGPSSQLGTTQMMEISVLHKGSSRRRATSVEEFVGASYAVRTSARESLHLNSQPECSCLVELAHGVRKTRMNVRRPANQQTTARSSSSVGFSRRETQPLVRVRQYPFKSIAPLRGYNCA